MKTKILSLLAIVAVSLLFFTACDPNKSIYDQLDSLQKPYQESFSYTLTDADYTSISNYAKLFKTHDDSLIAKDIASYKSFSVNRDISKYLPAFLAGTFKALDSSSAIIVSYKYDNKISIPTTSIVTLTDTFALDTISSTNTSFADSVNNHVASPVKDQYALVKFVGKNADNSTEPAYRLFVYSGTAWSHPTEAFELLYSDYKAMGGTIASYKNFSSTATPDFYLPIFLKTRFPYQVANTYLLVVYDYYLDHVHNLTVEKIGYDGTAWSVPEIKTSQFLHNGTAWVFDPSYYFTMTKADYQLVVDWVLSQDSIKAYVDSYKTSEYYFGMSSWYGNINLKLTDRTSTSHDPNGYLTGLSDADANAFLWVRAEQGVHKFLELKYPTQEQFVNGVQVYFSVTVDTYEPDRHKYTYKYKTIGTGQFELESGPTLVQ